MNHSCLKPALLATGLALSAAHLGATAASPVPEDSALVAEGKRLVANVGLCSDCHSARLPTGEFDLSRWLQGSHLPFEPLVEMPWAAYAPPIAGLPTFSDEEALRFLMTGERRAGPVRPPMPAYRFNESEARAIVAYLRSLPSAH